MARLFIPILILVFLCSSSNSDDQLTHAKPLTHGETLVSKGGNFALGFFSPTSSNHSVYLGIWYHNLPGPRIVVWVANRDNPITASSSSMLVVTNNSDLVLSNSYGHNIWRISRNITIEAIGAYAVLRNSGNFVLRLPNGTDIWQSFDHPTDTILPTMKFVWSYKAKVVGRLVSWKSSDDPSSGDFSYSSDPSYPDLQVVTWNKTKPYCRMFVWNGVSVSGGTYQANTNSILYQINIHSEGEFYYMFNVSGNSPFTRIMLDYTGKLKVLSWNSYTSSWALMGERPTAGCDLYDSCGPFSYCDFTQIVPTCQCLDGFEPEDINLMRGCRRIAALKCGNQSQFMALPEIKIPDNFVHIPNRSFDQCETECGRNCSCTAFAYANLSNTGAMADSSRCLIWSGGLIDIGKTPFGEKLYLRITNSTVEKKSNLVKIVLPIIAFLLLLASIALIWMYKHRVGKWRKKENRKKLVLGYFRTSNHLEGDNTEVPFFNFEDILLATNCFADSNLLGRGGFGKVYKGTLEGGNDVAVKRLGKGSGQGSLEFKSEVLLIAKLQHKNLVRLLGCCIDDDEKLLVYEYLPNKSLDAILFDATRKHVLDWLTRFKIIKGIARGLLYLHQDSRLTIIHRDLKASNILLDTEMTPKISDFGMARIFGVNQHQENTNRVVGTYGYMSPEYVMGGSFSVKSDTYSFGVLLLEIVSGLKISSPRLTSKFCSLISYTWRLWEDGNATKFIDSSFVANCPIHEVLRCIQVGLLCVQDRANDRPIMSSVMFMLENESALLPAPKQPVYFALSDCANTEGMKNIENSVNAMSITTLKGR